MTAAAAVPDVPTHEVGVPRIAVVHTWQNTQNEGWLRIALDESGIPYQYVSLHVLRDNAKLRDKYDVIIFGPSTPDPMGLVNGLAGDKPLPWKEKTPLTPNIGVEDSTDDMRGGIALRSVSLQEGGTFQSLNTYLKCSLIV